MWTFPMTACLTICNNTSAVNFLHRRIKGIIFLSGSFWNPNAEPNFARPWPIPTSECTNHSPARKCFQPKRRTKICKAVASSGFKMRKTLPSEIFCNPNAELNFTRPRPIPTLKCNNHSPVICNLNAEPNFARPRPISTSKSYHYSPIREFCSIRTLNQTLHGCGQYWLWNATIGPASWVQCNLPSEITMKWIQRRRYYTMWQPTLRGKSNPPLPSPTTRDLYQHRCMVDGLGCCRMSIRGNSCNVSHDFAEQYNKVRSI